MSSARRRHQDKATQCPAFGSFRVLLDVTYDYIQYALVSVQVSAMLSVLGIGLAQRNEHMDLGDRANMCSVQTYGPRAQLATCRTGCRGHVQTKSITNKLCGPPVACCAPRFYQHVVCTLISVLTRSPPSAKDRWDQHPFDARLPSPTLFFGCAPHVQTPRLVYKMSRPQATSNKFSKESTVHPIYLVRTENLGTECAERLLGLLDDEASSGCTLLAVRQTRLRLFVDGQLLCTTVCWSIPPSARLCPRTHVHCVVYYTTRGNGEAQGRGY